MNTKAGIAHITVVGTKTLTDASCYLRQYVINCTAAGTGPWTLKLQDRAAQPKVLAGPFALSVPTNGLPLASKYFDSPVPMSNGIDVVITGGANDGVVDVWTDFGQA